jgi:SAM-dependent methyltransferase
VSAAQAMAGVDRSPQSCALEGLGDAVNYRRWLASLAAPYLGQDPVEIGAGTGDYAAEWAQGGQRLTVTEADPSRLRLLARRFVGNPLVTVRPMALPTEARGGYSAVVALNVLEHIEDDVAALRSCAGLVAPGGLVVVLVPAFGFAMSAFDREIGHVRRYRVRTLTARLESAGLEPAEVRYVNPLGLLAWVVGMRLLRRRPRPGPVLRAWDRWVVPLARRWENGHQPAFGQSVFAVARRP